MTWRQRRARADRFKAICPTYPTSTQPQPNLSGLAAVGFTQPTQPFLASRVYVINHDHSFSAYVCAYRLGRLGRLGNASNGAGFGYPTSKGAGWAGWPDSLTTAGNPVVGSARTLEIPAWRAGYPAGTPGITRVSCRQSRNPCSSAIGHQLAGPERVLPAARSLRVARPQECARFRPRLLVHLNVLRGSQWS